MPRAIICGLFVLGCFSASRADDVHAGRAAYLIERLYNGIELPARWPPRTGDPGSIEPTAVPYLENPPTLIPIDVGRQLFVDDFLIETMSLQRTFHRPVKYDQNPVLRPVTHDELSADKDAQESVCYLGHGGAFFDPADRQYKLWYAAGWHGALALATSRDGLHWERPQLGGTSENLIFHRGKELDRAGYANCLWLDRDTDVAAERFKFMSLHYGHGGHQLRTSADGLSWSSPVKTGRASDLCGFFYNPFRKVWVYSVKRDGVRGRCRHYAESADFLREGIFDNSVLWTNADQLDLPAPSIGDVPQLYSLCGVAYESLLLGEFCLHYGPENDICDNGKFPKLTELQIGFSRDGFHWHRPDRRAFIGATRREGDWDRGHIRGPAGICFVAGDKLLFPYTGFSGIAASGARGMYCGGAIGLAILRRDGFASLDADSRGGEVLTRPLIFNGRHLFVNVDNPKGQLRAEILNEAGEVVEPYSLDNCRPISADQTLQAVHWNGAADLAPLCGKPVRLRFRLTNGRLYAFWVSPDVSGASYGYVAGGGPGYSGSIDTVGDAASTNEFQHR